MKKIALVLVALLIAAPAMAAVTIRATTDGEAPNVFRVQYEATGDDASGLYSLISGMAINVSISEGTMDIVPGSYKADGESTNASPGGGIYPGSIQFDVNKQVTSYGDPIAPGVDPGALGDLPGNACTVEVGVLYDDDAIPSAQALAIGVICKFEVTSTVESCVTLAVESVHRKGIVMEDGSAPSSTIIEDGVCLGGVVPPPECWSWLCQCHGDVVGDDCQVSGVDFLAFKDAWAKTYPDAAYDPCADLDRNGSVSGVDFLEFKDNWATTAPSDCPTGGTWPPEL